MDTSRRPRSTAVVDPSTTLNNNAQTSSRGPQVAHPNPFDHSRSVIAYPTDTNVTQQSIVVGAYHMTHCGAPRTSRQSQRHGIVRDLIASICLALGIDERKQQNRLALPTSESTAADAASCGRVHALGKSVLPPVGPKDVGKKCLVLDLDETLVHSSFRPTAYPHTVVPVEIDGASYLVYMCMRPGAQEFLVEMAQYFEIVVYTASLSKYADPLLDALDTERVLRYRLYREHCVQHNGAYVKDLSVLQRDMCQTIIVDNAPLSYTFHPQNAIGCSSFIDDPKDRELKSISRFLTTVRSVSDVREHLHMWDATY
ncbi:unnamed protein product [Hyaloperonospora brassicae]|uniref:FCP1 homology domain-containing protein n=1 Tax=Hyaloperonospora brassicae TaxID=162125 RepID=A0AAV0UEK7_HYABA|nr:unnamed protein product [Hyaloperonospora brassicae]